MAEFFESPRLYIRGASSLQDKICRLDAIILAMMDEMLVSATGEGTSEYSLNNGQTIIKESKRSVAEMGKSVEELEALKNIYINEFNGHSVRLVNHENTRFL